MCIRDSVYTSRLATKESYWIFHKDGDDFDLKVSDPKSPSYLLIANDPEMESIIAVSYTHLDVYKRQAVSSETRCAF